LFCADGGRPLHQGAIATGRSTPYCGQRRPRARRPHTSRPLRFVRRPRLESHDATTCPGLAVHGGAGRVQPAGRGTRGPSRSGRPHQAADALVPVRGKDRQHLQGLHLGLAASAGSAEGRPERADRPAGRCRLRPDLHLRRHHSHPQPRQAGGRGPAVQPVPHHRDLRPVTRRAADRTQPPRGRERLPDGVGHGIPELFRDDPEEHRDHR